MRPQSMGERLGAFLAEPLPAFDWASASCAHWAAAWVRHAIDVEVTLPGMTGPRDALRVIEAAGGMGPAVDAALGVPARPWAMAQIGDLMLFPSEAIGAVGVGWTLGICNGLVAAVRDEGGAVLFVPCDRAAACWSLRDVEEARQ
jgi:hypothetical protein